MKITKRRLRRIISEEIAILLQELPPIDVAGGGLIELPSEVGMQSHMGDPSAELGGDSSTDDADAVDPDEEDISESSQALPGVFKVLNRTIRGGRIAANPSIEGLFDAGLSMTSGEVKSRITTKLLGLNALELGLVGLAIGVPMLFFDEYSNAQKGDEMARFMAKSLRRPVEMKDMLDPRDPGNRDKIVRQGGSLKSNPILYLSSQENTNTAAQLFRDKIIGKDVFKAIQEIHQEKLQAAKQIKTMKRQSSNKEEEPTS